MRCAAGRRSLACARRGALGGLRGARLSASRRATPVFATLAATGAAIAVPFRGAARRCSRGGWSRGLGGWRAAEPAQQTLQHAAFRGRSGAGGFTRPAACRQFRLGSGEIIALWCGCGGTHAGDRWRLALNIDLADLGKNRFSARREPLVAGFHVLTHVGFANAGDLEVRCLEMLVGHDHHMGLVAHFNLDHGRAFFIEKEIGHRCRCLDQDLSSAFLHRMLFNESERR